jgi:hypothetical protein
MGKTNESQAHPANKAKSTCEPQDSSDYLKSSKTDKTPVFSRGF